MRVAGRDDSGLAKGLKTSQDGELFVSSTGEKKEMIGDFKEPYDEGYVGNITVSGLEVFEKIEVSSIVTDAKLGKGGIYIASTTHLMKFSSHEPKEPLWTYTDFPGTQIKGIVLDYDDNVIVSGQNAPGHQITEKINGETGELIWRNVNNSSNYISANDILVDKNGDVYLSGNISSNEPLTGQIRKHSGVDGSVIWTYVHTTNSQTLQWYVTLDSNNFVYLSHREGITKLDQNTANVTTPPKPVWNYPLENVGANGGSLYINADVDGFLYRNEQTYNGGVRGYKLVKINQNNGNPQKLWEKELSTLDIYSQVFIGGDGMIYHNNLGKIGANGFEFWEKAPPFTITDARNGRLVGLKKTNGYNHDVKYEVYVTGVDLKARYKLGVK